MGDYPSFDTGKAGSNLDEILILEEYFKANNVGPTSRELAERVVLEFGGIATAISASEAKLRSCNIGAAERALLMSLKKTISLVLKKKIEDRPILGCTSDVVNYLYVTMAHESAEVFRVIFLDNKLHVIHDETIAIGSLNIVSVSVRSIIKTALEVNANKLLLSHNHPSGSCEPSRNDVQLTARIQEVARFFDISVVDHIIISEFGYSSLRSLGMM